jgi:epoxyqueuosine reductase
LYGDYLRLNGAGRTAVGYHGNVNSAQVKQLARQCGFELAGVAPAAPLPEAGWFLEWLRRGFAGGMSYLTGRRAQMRLDPRSLLPSARSVICVGKLYNGPQPYSTDFHETGRAWISRYAWGRDYHAIIRRALVRFAAGLKAIASGPFEWRACVDTSPLLERAYARRAGLGWIGKNSCLIHQGMGSWFFLAELLVSLELEPDQPPPDRCGSCRRCIEACPTQAILPAGSEQGPRFTVDSSRCISYLTIELRGEIPAPLRPAIGRNVFGCDICQDVCPWNRNAPVTADPAFAAANFAPNTAMLDSLDEEQFRRLFRGSAVRRTGYAGFRRNLAVATGNSG